MGYSKIYSWDLALAQAATDASQNQPSVLSSAILMISIFVVFYILTIYPQRKKQKLLQKQIQEMKKGDFILSAGGLYMEVLDIKEDYISVKLGHENIKMKLAKWAVTSVIPKNIMNKKD